MERVGGPQGRGPVVSGLGPMVFSATKGMAATVIHRLADRG
ncbi:esterase domain protein [Mycobacterium ulcerans str. Harvey]|uniref:Esterase domain protein n=1 Tax=Mycobacterium ulcerans str. Harvey TaxID=1299332 RepID=A0ABN0RB96_MYCUL|nr:esterase domain protein [Mycobacterium ulcerans str. Harvey]